MHHRIAIVGAGFSGTVLAAQLLRHEARRETTIYLIERAPTMGRGVAYAQRGWPYLLNVPAGRLSADAQEPLQFLHFAQATRPAATAEDFLPRELYGDYLQEVLRRAEERAPVGTRLQRTSGDVVRVTRVDGDAALHLRLANGQEIQADQVVLAVGNPSPGVMPWAVRVRDHAAYRADPWSDRRGLEAGQTMVIIGSGLTMADVAVSSADDLKHAPQIVAISRHGLLPLPQSQFHAAAPPASVAAALTGVNSVREQLKLIRRLAQQAASSGSDWREIITAVRGVAPRMWQRLPERERRRFLRHARSFWDVHRHRVPTELADKLDALRGAGKLNVNAGRVVGIEANGERLRLTWRPRGRHDIHSVDADLVVNATGPELCLKRSSDGLLKSLCEQGWIAEDELALGMRVAANGACIDAAGVPSSRLYYVGPMLRATHWEATAATELRDHAAQLAAHLAAH